MKRLNGLMDKIATMPNLIEAEQKSRRGKQRSYGVKVFDKNREANLQALLETLKNGTYKTSQYTTFTIHEPKERLIYRLPYYPDRILHHAVMNVMEPVWVSIFVKNTYSCIKGRGIHRALNDVKRALKEDTFGTRYCLKIDIRKFYPSIDHTILKEIVRRKVKDTRLLHLLDEIIDSAPGVPIGNYLSQFFANLYLAYFDHWLLEERHVKHYFRYADDIVILSPDKETLHTLLSDITEYLSHRLHLTLKGNYQIFPVEERGIDFIGYVFRHTYTRLRKSTKQNICRKVKRDTKRVTGHRERRLRIGSYIGWMKYCNTRQLKHKLNTVYNETVL